MSVGKGSLERASKVSTAAVKEETVKKEEAKKAPARKAAPAKSKDVPEQKSEDLPIYLL